MFDVHGLVYEGRKVDMFAEKDVFAQPTNSHSLAEALVNADVFIGLSAGNILTQDMVRSMNDRLIIFALANPVPEISMLMQKKPFLMQLLQPVDLISESSEQCSDSICL